MLHLLFAFHLLLYTNSLGVTICYPQVPELLKGALVILYGGCSLEEIGAFLPIKLAAIKDVADASQREADRVVAEFNRVIETLTELQKSTLEIQGIHFSYEAATATAEFSSKPDTRRLSRQLS